MGLEALNYIYDWNNVDQVVHPAPVNQRDEWNAFSSGEIAVLVHGLAFLPRGPKNAVLQNLIKLNYIAAFFN